MMASPLIKKWLAFSLTALVVVALCQAVRLYFGDQVVLNPGIAFSLILPTSAIYIFSIALVAIVTWWHTKRRSNLPEDISLGLIVGGGVSNLLDRIFLAGNVADYISFFGMGYINLADVAIIAGIGLAFWYLSFDE